MGTLANFISDAENFKIGKAFGVSFLKGRGKAYRKAKDDIEEKSNIVIFKGKDYATGPCTGDDEKWLRDTLGLNTDYQAIKEALYGIKEGGRGDAWKTAFEEAGEK
jgi:hypothetical protein